MSNKDWSGSPGQVAFSSAVDQADQYREAVYALINALRARGWTIPRSSNGTTASAADNIASKADIVFGTEASQAHTWAYLKPPVGKGAPIGGVEHTILINCNNSNADTTPQNVDLYLGKGTYVGGAGGTTTTKPTILAGGFEGAVKALNIIPWAAATAGKFSINSADDGDLFMTIKQDAISSIYAWFYVRDDLDNAVGNYVMTMHGSSSTSDQLTASGINNTANMRGLTTSGGADLAAMECNCLAWDGMGSFTAGKESNTNRVPFRDIEVTNDAAANSRQLGIFQDLPGVPANAVFAEFDTEDLLNTGGTPYLFVVGDVAIPVEANLT